MIYRSFIELREHMSRRVRPIAICVLRRGPEILVFEARDSSANETFYRPLGGGVEFGELGETAVVREIREEIGAEIVNVRYLATLENIFELEGSPAHEIVLVYEADFAGSDVYERDEMIGTRDDGTTFDLRWMRLEYFRAGKAPLYPDGLLELLSDQV